MTIFNLYVSDAMISKVESKRFYEFFVPILIYSLQQLYKTIVNKVYTYNEDF